MSAEKLTDQQIRDVNLSKSRVGIGGSVRLVSGPGLVGMKRPADFVTVYLFNRPGNKASSVRIGVTHQFKPEDIVVISADTGHWFTHIEDRVTYFYFIIRNDPGKVTPIKDEVETRTYLSKAAL